MGDKKGAEDSLFPLSAISEDYESEANVKGLPFYPKDYMISPSDSDATTDKESFVTMKKKILPIDLKLNQDALDAGKSLKKLKNLIRDKFGRNFVKRQGNLVRAVVRGMPSGFLMADIASITEVIEYFVLNCKSVPEYIEMIIMILRVSVKPPKLTKSSETLNFKKELGSYFTMLGELLAAFDDISIQFLVLEILNSLLVRPEPVDVACIKLPFCYAAMEESLLPYTIASLLETVPYQLYIVYLNVTLQIALASKKASIAMSQNGAMEYILRRLDRNNGINEMPADNACSDERKSEERRNEYYDILDTVGHLMWIFLNNITDSEVCDSPSQTALQILREVFHVEVWKKTDKAATVRNNLASIVIKLYTVFGETLPLLQSGLAVDIAMLAVATEIGTNNTWAENICFGASKENYYLKELMLIGCCMLVRDKNMSQILKEQKVLEGILQLINPDVTLLSVPWSFCQFIFLFKLGLVLLSQLVPIQPEVYIANEGNFRLLLTIKWFMEEHFDRLPVFETLKTLSALVSCGNNSAVIQDLKKRNAYNILLNLCFYLLSKNLKKEHQENLTRTFFILEKLCKNDRKIQARCGNLCITVSIKFLTRVTENKEEDNKLEPSMLICFSSFLWEAVVWCQTSLKCFIEKNGIYLLLDLIEMSSYPIQIILLGLLVDVAEEGDTLTHLLTWRDKNGYGILNTMIKIWKKEELLYNVPRTENGCIADIERVLMTEEQWYLTHCAKKVGTCSPAIAEMMCNARPKIHSLYRFLKDRYGELTRLNESLYSISFEAVQPPNQVYVPLIEHFFTLKLGEIWYEIYNEVILGGLVPTLVDGETLRKLVERRNEWAYHLKTLQEEIIIFQKNNNTNDEGKLYDLIRSCCMTSALDALHELDFVTRTTYKDVEINQKAVQLNEIEGSLNTPHGIDDNHIHRTVLRDSNVTYLCGKYVWFKSEREVVPESSLLQPVSPSSSSCYKIDG